MDSCAFDPKYQPEDKSAEEIFYLFENSLEISHSVQKEIDHPNTPDWVKRRANRLAFTLPTDFTEDEKRTLCQIEITLAGQGNIENIRQDARHIFEAQKHGHYFVTTDKRILERRDDLYAICSCSLSVVKPSELWKLVEKYAERFPVTL